VLCIGHGAELNGLIWTTGDQRVASVDRDGHVISFDAVTGEATWREKIAGVAAEPALSADGQRLFVGARSGELLALDSSTGARLAEATLEDAEFNAIGVDPQSGALYGGTMDGALILLDAESLQERARYQRHDNRISAIRFAPDGRTMVTSSYDRTLAFSRVGQLGAERVTDLGGERNSWYTDAIDDIAISPNGRLVAVAFA